MAVGTPIPQLCHLLGGLTPKVRVLYGLLLFSQQEKLHSPVMITGWITCLLLPAFPCCLTSPLFTLYLRVCFWSNPKTKTPFPHLWNRQLVLSQTYVKCYANGTSHPSFQPNCCQIVALWAPPSPYRNSGTTATLLDKSWYHPSPVYTYPYPEPTFRT